MRPNLGTSLKCRARKNTMARFDKLPAPLRAWLAQAALPWSAESALSVWRKAGDPERALHRLSVVEQRMIARDAARIWGKDHPAGM